MDPVERSDDTVVDAVPDESDAICPICRCTIEESDPRVTTTCSHPYHFSCFMQMAQTSDTCSICRANLYDIPGQEGGEERSGDDVQRVNTGVGTITANEDEVIEIEVSMGEIENIRQQVRSRLNTSRRTRQIRLNNSDDDDDDDENEGNDRNGNGNGNGNLNMLDFEEDADLRRSRMTFTIFQACDQGHLARVRSIINENDEMKYAVDDENNTLVHEAVFSDSEPLMRYLVNDLNLSTNSTNRAGMSPLHFAAFAKSTRTASFLLNCGAFVDPRDDAGRTPLMVACQKGDNAMCAVLLDRGASVRKIDKNGESALHHAARGKCIACVRTLLRQPREDPNCCNFVGETPLHTACCAGSHTAVRFMLNSGGDPDIKSRAGSTPADLVPRENARLRSLIQRHSSL